MSFLVLDIPFDGDLGDRPEAPEVIRTAPQTREIRFQPRKFFPKLMRRESLELGRLSLESDRPLGLKTYGKRLDQPILRADPP
jgi:hypothetical protein